MSVTFDPPSTCGHLPCGLFLFLLDRDLEVVGGEDFVASSAALVDELAHINCLPLYLDRASYLGPDILSAACFVLFPRLG